MFLNAKGVEVSNLEGDSAGGRYNATGRVWHPVSVRDVGGDQPVHVAVPVRGEVTLDSKGVISSDVSSPTDDDVAEASAYVGSLAAHGQIATAAAPKASGATHEIEVDDTGRQRLVRKRFSAV